MEELVRAPGNRLKKKGSSLLFCVCREATFPFSYKKTP
jgi:hypothetical protein